LHWVHAAAFLVLLATGLALYLPSLAELVGRRPLLKDIHVYTAVAWAVAIVAVVLLGDRRALRRTLHEIDVLHWMINAKVARVYASGGNNVLKQRETIDHAGIVIDYENGVKFTFNFCLYGQSAGAPVARLMVLAGTQGIMQTTAERNKVSIRKQGAKEQLIDAGGAAPGAITARESGPDQDTGTYREYLAFANSIRTGEKPLVSGEVGKDAIKISLLAEKSLRERRIMTWNDLPA